MMMTGEWVQHNIASLEELLQAGKDALDKGDRRSAHEYWRLAAVTHPYDERVWVALLGVLTDDSDREVCLENIIAINPLNSEARRQLRTVRSVRRPVEEDIAPDDATVVTAPAPTTQTVRVAPVNPPDPTPAPTHSAAASVPPSVAFPAIEPDDAPPARPPRRRSKATPDQPRTQQTRPQSPQSQSQPRSASRLKSLVDEDEEKAAEFKLDKEVETPEEVPLSPLVRSITIGVGVGLAAILLGIIASIVAYGGLLPTRAP